MSQHGSEPRLPLEGGSTGASDDEQKLARFPFALMTAGLAASYGTFAFFASKFLYPSSDGEGAWLFVCPVKKLARGESLIFKIPGGESVAVARNGDGETADDFVALSSTCPHLGCQVNWEAKNDRFFCPCHNGAFDRTGKATEGPPAQAGTDLARYDLQVERQLLYIRVKGELFARESGTIVEPVAIRGPGHDACLAPRTPESKA